MPQPLASKRARRATPSHAVLSQKQLAALRAAPVGDSPLAPNRLRYALALAGVTLTSLSVATGINLHQLSRLQRGTLLYPNEDTMARPIAAFFGCTVKDLFPSGVYQRRVVVDAVSGLR